MLDINLSQFYNEETLNIFSDASIFGKGENTTGCYEVVAVCMDKIIDVRFRFVSETTNNNSELKGIRCAIGLALQYQDQFQYINIFSDSQISIFGLRDYIYKWKFYDGKLYGTANKPIANQEIFIEAHQMLTALQLNPNCRVNLYHQAGHVDNGYNNLCDAANVFRRSNNIFGVIDLNFIRYISTYNNFVDLNSRSQLRRMNKDEKYYDPVSFFSTGKINRY